MPNTKKKRIFIIFWVILAYVIAALGWWYIELNKQNEHMRSFELENLELKKNNTSLQLTKVNTARNKNTYQYIGEGVTFLLLLLGGGFFILRSLKRELLQTEQQRNFMMAVTHELKTPIAVAKLNLETIQKHQLQADKQQKLLVNTLQETNRLDMLCNNLLVSSQLETSGYKMMYDEISFSNCVEECVANFENRYPKQQFVKNIEPNIFVIGDYFLLQMAINNLLENAIKYGGKEKIITIGLATKTDNALLSIVDEGVGISDEEKKMIFAKYYRIGNEATKRAKGTGLGLYIVKNICKLHNTTIVVSDNKNAGSIFSFALKIVA